MNSWPLFALVLHTPRLALRLGSDEQLDALASASVGRVLPPEQGHFMSTDWTQLPSPVYERSFMQFHWKARADWRAESWGLQLIAFHQDAAVGGFGLLADDFAAQRRVRTGLWLLPEYRGQGIGTEAHAALLHLAFAELGAREAFYDVHPDNTTSRRLSHAMGYEETGTFIETHPGGRPTRLLDQRLTYERWNNRQGPPVRVDGLDDCREMFGLKR
jgi:RimJ/RimL family protein N-acetyltransferase